QASSTCVDQTRCASAPYDTCTRAKIPKSSAAASARDQKPAARVSTMPRIITPCDDGLPEQIQDVLWRGEPRRPCSRSVASRHQGTGVLFISTEREQDQHMVLETARSGLPSPLKSPTAMDAGRLPAPKASAAWKVPLPVPCSTNTWLELGMATARSGSPSPLRSPTVTERGPLQQPLPSEKFVSARKVPSPLPSSTETLAESKLATARSCTPSPLKSPTVTESR